eukprot:TRINITY_DN103399_c0_g1_i1.p1 TRINITY_DN103399_c0_g1~~TRINITY_DN103399_c0_g1_i1.p1  ORF type:complete len:220 (-),score=40.38 TRINITY_DN103399_c0_g1_i1:119-778(-)
MSRCSGQHLQALLSMPTARRPARASTGRAIAACQTCRLLLLSAGVLFTTRVLLPLSGEPASWLCPPLSQRGAASRGILRRAEASFDAAGQAVGDSDTTPLMLAAFRNDEEEVRGFATAGADLNAQDAYGWTALRYAVRARQLKSAEVLLELGADANKASKTGRTPLMSAASNGFPDAVRILLEHGADASLKDNNGQTALDHALRGGSLGCLASRDLLSK